MTIKSNLTDLVRTIRVSDRVAAVAAGQTVNGDGVDLGDADAVRFLVLLGSTDTTGDIKVQQSDDDGVGDDYSDLEGSAVSHTATDDNKILIVDVLRPTKPYLRPVAVLASGTAGTVIDGMIAELYRVNRVPVTQDDNVSVNTLVSPAEGTA